MSTQDNADGLVVLAVDDEMAGLDELRYLLEQSSSVSRVFSAFDAAEALRLIRTDDPQLKALSSTTDCPVDAVFADVSMPGLSGMEFARVLGAFREPPALVFVTGHPENAVEAFEVGAVDYVVKPVEAERLERALSAVRKAVGPRRTVAPETPSQWPAGPRPVDSERSTQPHAVSGGQQATAPGVNAPQAGTAERQAAGGPGNEEVIPVELAGTTKLIPRASVRWVEAQGDYARLHTTDGSHLVRIPLAQLEERWANAGFVRIHRSYLVALHRITELRMTSSGYSVMIDGGTPKELPVSRRHTRALKDRLVGGRRNGLGPQ